MAHITDKNGFTLVELLVGLAMASIVVGAIVLSYQAQVRGQASQQVTLEMQQGGRAGLEIMSRDIRMAGCDPTTNANAGIVTANPAEIEFTMDISGGGTTGNEPDGDTDDASEHIRYAISASGHLGRETIRPTGSSGLQPLVRDVDWLNFVYLDEDGNVTANRDDIRAVEVTFVARASGSQRGLLPAFDDNNTYSNERGTASFTPSGDAKGFRRMQFTTRVFCRNLGK